MSHLTYARCQSCRVERIWLLVVKGIALRVCSVCDLGYVRESHPDAA